MTEGDEGKDIFIDIKESRFCAYTPVVVLLTQPHGHPARIYGLLDYKRCVDASGMTERDEGKNIFIDIKMYDLFFPTSFPSSYTIPCHLERIQNRLDYKDV